MSPAPTLEAACSAAGPTRTMAGLTRKGPRRLTVYLVNPGRLFQSRLVNEYIPRFAHHGAGAKCELPMR
jgi:hypothetical protein